MNVKNVLLTCIASIALFGCGGGGGGSDSAPAPATTENYQLWQAWVNYATASATRNFTIDGSVNGVSVTGSGLATTGSLSSATFEGKAALRKTTTISGTISVAGQTLPYGGSSTTYLDTNYLPLGSSDGEYAVVTGTSIPQTAKVNDTSVLYTYTRYPSSAKSYSTGTGVVTFALVPETASTSLLKVISADKSTSGGVEATTIATFRITPAGALTPLSEEYQSGAMALTLRY